MNNIRELGAGFVKLNFFLKKVRAKPSHLLIPVVFALLASACEALGIAALTPFMKGFLSQDFGFVKAWPLTEWVMSVVPEAFRYKNSTFFVIFIVVIVAAMALKVMMSYVSFTSLSFQARTMNDHLRRTLMERYLGFGKLYFDKTGAGQQLQVLMTHPVRISQTLVSINGALSAVFLLLVYFISIWCISWQLTLMVVVFSPLVIFSQQWLLTKIRASSATDAAIRADLNQKTVNILSGIPFIQSQCAEDREKKLYAGLSQRQQQTEYSIDKKRNFVGPVQEISTLLILLVILSAMSFLMVRYHIGSVAQYTVYFFVLRRIMVNVQAFNILRADLATVAAPIREVLEVLDDADKPFVAGGNEEFKGLENAIVFRNLTFSYSKQRPIIDGVSLTMPKGRLTAIVGPSGSGKSTIIQLLLRFYDCPPESILIDGRDIRSFTLSSLRKKMGWVSQEAHLFNDTLRANILFGLDQRISDTEILEALRRARLLKLAEDLPNGLDTLIGDRGVNLSGGEKQRVSIARAILKKPQILLLDEATSALDTVTESQIQEALAELIAGQTAIVIAHRLSTIRHADHVIYMENGRVIEEGSHQELLDLRGRFSASWQAQKFY